MGKSETFQELSDREGEKDRLQEKLYAEYDALFATFEAEAKIGEEIETTIDRVHSNKTIRGKTTSEMLPNGRRYALKADLTRYSDGLINYHSSGPIQIVEEIPGQDGAEPTSRILMSFHRDNETAFVTDHLARVVVRGPKKKLEPDASKMGFRKGLRNAIETSRALRDRLDASRPGRMAK
jgi:hypothetical protein